MWKLLLILPLLMAIADCSDKATTTIGDGFTDCSITIKDSSGVDVSVCDQSDNSVVNNEIAEPE